MLSSLALAAHTPPSRGAADTVIKVLYYLGLSSAAGLGLTLGALAPSRASGGLVAARTQRTALAVAAFVAVTAVLDFVSQAARAEHTSPYRAADAHELSVFVHAPASRGDVIGNGVVTLIQMGVYTALVLAIIAVHLRANRIGGYLVFVLAMITAVLPIMPFHRATVDETANAVLTATHVVGALTWVGGLVFLAVLGIGGLVGPHGRRDRAIGDNALQLAVDWTQIWRRFSAIALFAVGAVLLSGSWLAWTHVGTPAEMFTTPYGRYLTVKLVLVVLMLASGAYNVRVLLPRIRAARAADDTATVLRIATGRFPKVVAAEAVLAVGVLTVVPFLRGSARMQAGAGPARQFDLTVFGIGLVLLVLIAAALWAGTRVPRLLPRRRTHSSNPAS